MELQTKRHSTTKLRQITVRLFIIYKVAEVAQLLSQSNRGWSAFKQLAIAFALGCINVIVTKLISTQGSNFVKKSTCPTDKWITKTTCPPQNALVPPPKKTWIKTSNISERLVPILCCSGAYPVQLTNGEPSKMFSGINVHYSIFFVIRNYNM